MVMVARMTPNGDEDNEDGNSKKNDKATMKPPTTTEDEGECRQSLKDNRGRGHHRPRDAAIAPTSYVHSGVCVGNSLPRHDPDSQPKKGQLNRMSPTCRANIHNMSATDVCRLGGVADRHKSRHCQPSLLPWLLLLPLPTPRRCILPIFMHFTVENHPPECRNKCYVDYLQSAFLIPRFINML